MQYKVFDIRSKIFFTNLLRFFFLQFKGFHSFTKRKFSQKKFGFIVVSSIYLLGYSAQSYAQLKDLNDSSEKKIEQQGKRIYRDGILIAGDSITAIAEADVELNGSQAACSNCHRRSGMGTNEGQTVIPPVTQDILYQAKTLGREGRHQYVTEGPGTRPAYNAETLKRAIREGIDPTGYRFDRLMPHFNLPGKDADALISYMNTLRSNGSPGVDDTHIHFATIVTEGVDQLRKKAMIDVLETFFKEKNAGTRLETRRSKYAPWHRDWKYQSYRKWTLHIWELKGASETWLTQLEEYYYRQPIFAMLNGLADGSWGNIHQFCEMNEIPCLFPNTIEPVVSDSDYYTIYFSKGMTLEADVLAKFLSAQKDLSSSERIVQVYRIGGSGEVASHRMRQNLSENKGVTVVDIPISQEAPPNSDFWKTIFTKYGKTRVILWLEKADLVSLDSIPIPIDGTFQLFVSSTLVPQWSSLGSDSLNNKIYAVHPYQKPDAMTMHLVRINTWLALRKIASQHINIQANAFFTVRAVGRAIMHLRDKYSREYFLELIEHVSEKLFVSSVYPRLTLAPGQRYASKGGYILKKSQQEERTTIEPVSEWIVP